MSKTNNIAKYVTDLKDKHKGEDIYVICSGKSCDFIDESFFENKITIGVNQVFQKFKTTYLVRKENNHMIDVINKCPDTIHCITEGNCGIANKTNLNTYNQNKSIQDKNIFFIKHLQNTRKINIPSNDEQLIISYSTSITAIHLAAYLGAANILLVGHDGGSINGEINFTGYYDNFRREQSDTQNYANWLKNINDQPVQMKNFLKEKYGCNLYSINPFTSLRLDGNKFE